MKSHLILISALLAFGPVKLYAQPAANVKVTENSIHKKGKYAMLVMKTQHLIAGIKIGIDLKSRSQKIDFHLLVCGELVKDISLNEDLQNLISDAVRLHCLTIIVCGLSIQQFNVKQSLLPKEMTLSDNGLIHMFGLQEQGFKTIIL
jgi:thioredoxin-related protein